jgi:hypothetical protein
MIVRQRIDRAQAITSPLGNWGRRILSKVKNTWFDANWQVAVCAQKAYLRRVWYEFLPAGLALKNGRRRDVGGLGCGPDWPLLFCAYTMSCNRQVMAIS